MHMADVRISGATNVIEERELFAKAQLKNFEMDEIKPKIGSKRKINESNAIISSGQRVHYDGKRDFTWQRR